MFNLKLTANELLVLYYTMKSCDKYEPELDDITVKVHDLIITQLNRVDNDEQFKKWRQQEDEKLASATKADDKTSYVKPKQASHKSYK